MKTILATGFSNSLITTICQEETEMKRVSANICMQNSNKVWNFHCSFFHLHIFFQWKGEKKWGQKSNSEITGICAYMNMHRVGIWTRNESACLWGFKWKGSLRAGRSFDSLPSRGCWMSNQVSGGPLWYTWPQMAGVWPQSQN